MTIRFHCAQCGAKGPRRELPEHTCAPEPKPDPVEELVGQIPLRPEAPVAPWLINRPADYGMNLSIPTTKEKP